jgi:hypothetical protein
MKFLLALIYVSFLLGPQPSQAQTVEDGEHAVEIIPSSHDGAGPATDSGFEKRARPNSSQPKVGRSAAGKYMGVRGNPPAAEASAPTSGYSEFSPGGKDGHYLAVHFGTYISDNAYKWGNNRTDKSGNYNIGVTYRLGEWTNSMDLALRVDFSEYSLVGGTASKLSFLPVITFPDASSHFPLYFGVGAGLGVFLHQLHDKSALGLDYQVLAGVRFFNVIETTGFFLEAGLKNHVLLLSEGQFNGPFVAAGAVFTF